MSFRLVLSNPTLSEITDGYEIQLHHGTGHDLPRYAIERLAELGEGTALLLYNVLQAEHGHKRDHEFSIVPDALKASGKLKVGRRQIYDAIQVLLDEGLLEVAVHSRTPRVPHLYRLTKGERFINYIEFRKGYGGEPADVRGVSYAA